MPRIRELGFQGAHYSDVLSMIGPRPCYDPRHPQTRRQDAEAAIRILARAQKVFGGVQSEGSLDFAAPALDRLLYIDCDKWSPLRKKPYVDTRVPLYQTVYHGVLLYNLSTEVVNSQPGEDRLPAQHRVRRLAAGLLLRALPARQEAKNWLGQRDYRYDDGEGLKQTVAGLRRVSDDFQRLGAPADGVSRRPSADRRRGLRNHLRQRPARGGQLRRAAVFAVGEGEAVPPRAYLLIEN